MNRRIGTTPVKKSPAPKRRRVITWQDPQINGRAIRSMGGMDYLQALQKGQLPHPPVMKLIGYSLVQIDPGHCVFELDPAEYHYNPNGTVHGGVLSTMLDSAMGSAVRTQLPLGTSYVTVEFKVNFMRAVNDKTGRLRCEGQVIHQGARVAVAEGRVIDPQGKLYAHGTTTCLIVRSSGA